MDIFDKVKVKISRNCLPFAKCRLPQNVSHSVHVKKSGENVDEIDPLEAIL
jgi:hypothetical protein